MKNINRKCENKFEKKRNKEAKYEMLVLTVKQASKQTPHDIVTIGQVFNSIESSGCPGGSIAFAERCGVSHSSVSKWMQVANHYDSMSELPEIPKSVLYLITANKCPGKVRHKIDRSAREGRKWTEKEVKLEIAAHHAGTVLSRRGRPNTLEAMQELVTEFAGFIKEFDWPVKLTKVQYNQVMKMGRIIRPALHDFWPEQSARKVHGKRKTRRACLR